MGLSKFDRHPTLSSCLCLLQLWRADLGLALLCFLSEELVFFKIWACQTFTHMIVHKEPKAGGVEVARV